MGQTEADRWIANEPCLVKTEKKDNQGSGRKNSFKYRERFAQKMFDGTDIVRDLR
jgi:hypothetical protein